MRKCASSRTDEELLFNWFKSYHRLKNTSQCRQDLRDCCCCYMNNQPGCFISTKDQCLYQSNGAVCPSCRSELFAEVFLNPSHQESKVQNGTIIGEIKTQAHHSPPILLSVVSFKNAATFCSSQETCVDPTYLPKLQVNNWNSNFILCS